MLILLSSLSFSILTNACDLKTILNYFVWAMVTIMLLHDVYYKRRK